MADERNIRLLLEYDGSAYGGWQVQEGVPTIQGCLAEAVFRMTSERAVLRAAARTDAGVHARGQVVAFRTRSAIEPRRFAPGLNAHLPDDISVHETSEAPLLFDPRRDSESKRYRYRVYCGPQPAALENHRCWMLRTELDLDAMRRAAAPLVGEHDFEAFRSAQCDAAHARRLMLAIDIERRPRPPAGEAVEITFHANAYCRHMCRILAGTLVEVGRGVRDAAKIPQVLASRDRSQAGVTAPAAGLTLLEVLF